MNIPSWLVPLIVGAILGGFSTFFFEMIRDKLQLDRRREIEKEEWLSRTAALVRRLHTPPYPLTEKAILTETEDIEKSQQMVLELADELDQWEKEAPHEIDPEIRENIRELVKMCRELGELQVNLSEPVTLDMADERREEERQALEQFKELGEEIIETARNLDETTSVNDNG